MNKNIVRLSLNSRLKLIIYSNKLFDGEDIIKVVDPFDDEDEENYVYPHATLKDIAIIMYNMVGNGVTRHLANELSKRLGIDNKELVLDTLLGIWKEYYYLSEEEAINRYEKQPK